MTDAIPAELLDFLLRTLPTASLWEWLSAPSRKQLQQRVTQGFRANAGVLRQPVARGRFASHLQTTPQDFESLLEIWKEDPPKVLEAVRAQRDDPTLIAQLPVLQAFHGAEALVLALLCEEREAVLEAFAEIGEERREYHSSENEEAQPDPETLSKQLQHTQERLEKHRLKARETKEAARQTEKKLRDQLRDQENKARTATREARQFELRLEALTAKLEEAEKNRDRAERKARNFQTENEDHLAQIKTLRRQLHRLQQLNEETRSRFTALNEELKEQNEKLAKSESERSQKAEKPAQEKESPPPAATQKPLIRRGTYKELITLDAKKIVTAIKRGDEKSVALFRPTLTTLRKQNKEAWNALLAEIRALSRYSERVLTQATTRALVDASNVARYDGPGRGKIEYLYAMREELQRFDFFPILFIADASLPYHIDAVDEFRNLVRKGEFLISASGQEADEILAREARETGAYVITNDRNFHRHLAPVFVPMRIGFQIFDNTVVLEEF